jgi:SAM-dependent methyltransferase
LILRVASVTHLSPSDRVLDLGCGPGFLAAAFAPYVNEVVALDPEPAMLAAAADYVRERGVRVSLQQGSSYDLGAHLGMFQLVTMGRSFHWMDRPATLEALSRLIVPDGAVALFSDSHLDVPANAWHQQFESILESYAQRDPGHARTERKGPSWLPHEAILLDSPFNRLERLSVIRSINTPVEQLIDRALSMSSTSPERLGPDLDTLVAKLRHALTEAAPSGNVQEVVEIEALLGFLKSH